MDVDHHSVSVWLHSINDLFSNKNKKHNVHSISYLKWRTLFTGSSMNEKMSWDWDQHHAEPSLQNQGKIEEWPGRKIRGKHVSKASSKKKLPYILCKENGSTERKKKERERKMQHGRYNTTCYITPNRHQKKRSCHFCP